MSGCGRGTRRGPNRRVVAKQTKGPPDGTKRAFSKLVAWAQSQGARKRTPVLDFRWSRFGPVLAGVSQRSARLSAPPSGASPNGELAERVAASQHGTGSGYAWRILRQLGTSISVHTKERGLHEVTVDVQGWVAASGFGDGLLTVFVQHRSASLLIQENADPDVRGDLDRFFAWLVHDGHALFRHQHEGPDDMPAHVRPALTAVQLSIPLQRGQLVLGTWRGIYLWEHPERAHRREVALHLLGE